MLVKIITILIAFALSYIYTRSLLPTVPMLIGILSNVLFGYLLLIASRYLRKNSLYRAPIYYANGLEGLSFSPVTRFLLLFSPDGNRWIEVEGILRTAALTALTFIFFIFTHFPIIPDPLHRFIGAGLLLYVALITYRPSIPLKWRAIRINTQTEKTEFALLLSILILWVVFVVKIQAESEEPIVQVSILIAMLAAGIMFTKYVLTFYEEKYIISVVVYSNLPIDAILSQEADDAERMFFVEAENALEEEDVPSGEVALTKDQPVHKLLEHYVTSGIRYFPIRTSEKEELKKIDAEALLFYLFRSALAAL